MTSVACPYCYNRINPAKLYYQCAGRATPGHEPCRKIVNEDRKRLTGYSAEALPSFAPTTVRSWRANGKAHCPECGSPSGPRVCPKCRTPLPANFADSRSPLIGVVGGKAAGKTVYMTVLAHELRRGIRRRFDADVQFVGDQPAGSESVARWLDEYDRALFVNRRLLEPTRPAIDGLRVPLLLQWRQAKRTWGWERFNSSTLSFYDAAGEDMSKQEFVNGQAYLSAADGLIVLLDPFHLAGIRDRIPLPNVDRRDAEPPINVLTRITDLLRNAHTVSGRGRIDVPVSVVFSKVDAFYPMLGDGHPLLRLDSSTEARFDEQAGRDTDEHVRALLQQLDADEIDAHLRSNYQRFRYFAVSSLGAPPDYGSGQVNEGGVRPFRVGEPLLWLLSEFKIIKRTRV